MKKAVYHSVRDIRVEEVEEPKPDPTEAKVRVKYCGICGSDLHEYLHGRFPQSRFGHEASGEIVELGSELKGFQVGDRVGAYDRGGFAEYTLCSENQLFKLPDWMNWKQAAALEPLSVAVKAITLADIKPSCTVLIAGAGPIGLMHLLALKAVGCKAIYLTDPSEVRRKKAHELGASAVLNPEETEVSHKIKEYTGGTGVDVTIEAVGTESTLKDCLTSVKWGGKVVVEGIFTERVSLNMFGFVVRETTMIGMNSTDPKLAISWVESKGIRPESIITSVIPLAEITSKGFELLARKTKEEIKILVKP